MRRSLFRVLGLLVCLLTVEIVMLHGQHRSLSLHVLDVGQGDAILLRSGRVDVLVDGGPDAAVIERLGAARPFWDRRLDIVVLTHPQQDHLRGLLDVIEREQVGLVLLPEIPATSQTFARFIQLLRERHIPVRAARAGTIVKHGDLTLTILAPDPTLLSRARKNANIGSVVFRVDMPGTSTLLTGDIEAPTEQYLRTHVPQLLDVDILKVPHHGSKTSSTPAFLRAVTPMLSLMSVGKGNRYGHPHAAVVQRYPKQALLRTDTSGTISVIMRKGKLFLRCSRLCGKE